MSPFGGTFCTCSPLVRCRLGKLLRHHVDAVGDLTAPEAAQALPPELQIDLGGATIAAGEVLKYLWL